MKIKIFTLSLLDKQAEEEFNKFITSNRIIEIKKEFVVIGDSAFWTFCVTYFDKSSEYRETKGKIDYRQKLPPEIFEKFDRMREVRKKLADEDAVKVYTIFTNEELSQLAYLTELNLSTMKTVKGIGNKKIEKYGKRFLDLYFTSNEQNK